MKIEDDRKKDLRNYDKKQNKLKKLSNDLVFKLNQLNWSPTRIDHQSTITFFNWKFCLIIFFVWLKKKISNSDFLLKKDQKRKTFF